MQAADLLAMIGPGASGAAAPGATPGASAKGKAGAGAKAGSDATVAAGADATATDQGAITVDAFAQALAALLAAAGAATPQAPAVAAQASNGDADADGKGSTGAGNSAAPFIHLAAAQAAALATDPSAPASGTTAPIVEAATPAPTDSSAPVTTAAVTLAPVATAAVGETANAATSPSEATGLPPTASDKAAAAILAHRPATATQRVDWADRAAPSEVSRIAPQAAAASRGAAITPPANNAAPPPPATPVVVAAVALAAPAEPAPLAAAPPQLVPEDGAAQPAVPSLAGAEAAPTPAGIPAPGPRLATKVAAKAETKSLAAEGVEPGRAADASSKTAPTALAQDKKPASDTPQDGGSLADIQQAQAGGADKAADASVTPFADASRATGLVQAHAEAAKVATHTVAHLAEQIVSKTDGKATRFDVQLDPAGLGKVDVKIEIGRGGEINAALSFDNPVAAAEMRSRAGELRNALEQAGFDLSKGGLSFDFSGQQQGHSLWDQQADPGRPNWGRPSFADLSAVTDIPGLANRRMIDAGGVDVTV